MATGWRVWRYYGGFYRGRYVRLVSAILASIAQSFLQLPIVLLVRKAFDQAIPSRDFSALTCIGVSIIALYLASGGLSLYARYAVLQVTKLVIQRMRRELLQKMYAVSRAYYSEADLDILHTMAVQDTERVDIMSNALIAVLLPALLISVVLGAALVSLDWRMSLTLAAVVPPLVVVSRRMRRAVRKRTREFHRSFEAFSKGVAFVLETMDLTRFRSAEEWETQRQKQRLEELRLTSGRIAWLWSAYSLLNSTIFAISGVIVLVLGGRAVAVGRMTLGTLVSFSAAVALLRAHLYSISVSVPRVIEGSESLSTLHEFAQLRDSRPYSGTRRSPFGGRIRLAGVSFGYRDDTVLRDIDLIIEPGSAVALVGPNGAGKSTIAYLILGFYRPQSGQLYANGQPYDALDIMHLRRQIGVVSQDPIIFPGTVWENITYGVPDPSTAQVRRAAELSTADEFIAQLPKGYDTLVGERGVLLSGGQCQRIAVARALLGQPALLILDEPTNHLDERSIRRLIDNLSGLENGPAKLIISHDTQVTDVAERVYVLREGRVIESVRG